MRAIFTTLRNVSSVDRNADVAGDLPKDYHLRWTLPSILAKHHENVWKAAEGLQHPGNATCLSYDNPCSEQIILTLKFCRVNLSLL